MITKEQVNGVKKMYYQVLRNYLDTVKKSRCRTTRLSP